MPSRPFRRTACTYSLQRRPSARPYRTRPGRTTPSGDEPQPPPRPRRARRNARSARERCDPRCGMAGDGAPSPAARRARSPLRRAAGLGARRAAAPVRPATGRVGGAAPLGRAAPAPSSGGPLREGPGPGPAQHRRHPPRSPAGHRRGRPLRRPGRPRRIRRSQQRRGGHRRRPGGRPRDAVPGPARRRARDPVRALRRRGAAPRHPRAGRRLREGRAPGLAGVRRRAPRPHRGDGPSGLRGQQGPALPREGTSSPGLWDDVRSAAQAVGAGAVFPPTTGAASSTTTPRSSGPRSPPST